MILIGLSLARLRLSTGASGPRAQAPFTDSGLELQDTIALYRAKHAWDMKIISIDSLIRLLRIKESLSDLSTA